MTSERRPRVLHAIHDFLPRHRAGSEIYAWELCRALAPASEVCRYVAEVTIVRMIAFWLQPLDMNSLASQSSSSGWLGVVP